MACLRFLCAMSHGYKVIQSKIKFLYYTKEMRKGSRALDNGVLWFTWKVSDFETNKKKSIETVHHIMTLYHTEA